MVFTASFHYLYLAANGWIELFMLDTCGLAVIIIIAVFFYVVRPILTLSGSAVLMAISLPDRLKKRVAFAQQQKLRDSTDTHYVIAKLQTKDLWTQRLAIKRLGELGDPAAVDILKTMLQGDDAWSAIEAAEALGKIGDHRAVQALIHTLHSTEQKQTLDRMWENQEAEHDISLGWGLLREQEDLDMLRITSARALGAIGDQRAIPALQRIIADQNDFYEMHKIAREILTKLDEEEATG